MWTTSAALGLARGRRGGFTLIELMIVAIIVATLAALAVPNLGRVRERAQIAQAVGDVRALGIDAMNYQLENGALPSTLVDLGRGGMLDPWGNPYQYLVIEGARRGQLRKDRFLVPINSDFDLYSMGPDGDTNAALTAPVSRDDIIRANDGGYVGPASGY